MTNDKGANDKGNPNDKSDRGWAGEVERCRRSGRTQSGGDRAHSTTLARHSVSGFLVRTAGQLKLELRTLGILRVSFAEEFRSSRGGRRVGRGVSGGCVLVWWRRRVLGGGV
jgi:hypothetical protein